MNLFERSIWIREIIFVSMFVVLFVEMRDFQYDQFWLFFYDLEKNHFQIKNVSSSLNKIIFRSFFRIFTRELFTDTFLCSLCSLRTNRIDRNIFWSEKMTVKKKILLNMWLIKYQIGYKFHLLFNEISHF